MCRRVFWDFLHEIHVSGRTDTWISNLSVHRNFLQSLVKDANFLDPCAEVLGSGPELHFSDEDFGVIPKQVTSSMFWNNPSFQSLMTCRCPSDSELSNQDSAGNIPEMEMLTNNCPLVIQVRQNSPLQILYVRSWGLALCSYLLLKAHTLSFAHPHQPLGTLI